MQKSFLSTVFFLLTLTLYASAQSVTPDEQSFIDSHLSDYIATKSTRLADDSLVKVFSVPFYKIRITLTLGGSVSETITATVAKVEGHLVGIESPGTDTDLPIFPKMINPTFKLETDADATAFQQALDTLYPHSDEEKKAIGFTHIGNTWYFARGMSSCRIGGKEFECHKGFQIKTDPSGVVTSAVYTLYLDGPLAYDHQRRPQ